MHELIPVLLQFDETRDFEIVIVNDNSTDRTSAIIEELASSNPKIKPVHRHSSPGFGNAVKEGMKNATGDIIIPVMGDLSDDPHDIPKLVRKIEEGYDIAYGSRFTDGGVTEGYPNAKMVANRAFNNTVRLLFGIRHKDLTNAFKAYRKEVLDAIGIDNLEATGFDLTVEIPLKAHIMGFTSAEVPVTWHGRKRGVAKLKLSENGSKYGKRLLTLFFSVLLRTSGYVVPRDILFKSLMFGYLLNYFLPARAGDLARGAVLKTTEKTPMSISLPTIVIERAMDMLTLAVLLGLSAVLLSKSSTVLTLAGISFAIAVLLIFMLFLAGKYDLFISRKLGNRIPAIAGFLVKMKEGIGKMFDNPSALILSLVISLPVWFFEISGTYLAARAIGYPISFSVATVAGITAFISQTIPVTPAGIGVYEGTMAGVFTLFDIPLSIGVSLALVDHFIRSSVVLIFGMMAAVHLGFASRAYFVNKHKSEVDDT